MIDQPNPRPRPNWFERRIPSGLWPFARLMRLDKPIGWWLLLLPGWWSIVLASFGRPSGELMVLFLIGAIVTRGTGCTLNDIADRDFDAHVARTATRPLPSKQISVRDAWAFLVVLVFVSIAILIQLNPFAIKVGLASVILIVTYPFMKRITFWPQAWLGLTFNWGALLGWAAVMGRLDLQAVLLYAAGFFWILGYDTIYALQDLKDDALAGVKSSALALGARARPIIALFYGVTFILLAAAIVPPNNQPVAIGLLALAGAHLIWQVVTLDIADTANCTRRFKSNRDFGLIVLAACWAAWL